MGEEAEGDLNCPAKAFRLYQCVSRLLVLGVFFFPFVFGACRSEQGKEPGSLEERVKGFWEARIGGDNLKAYSYEAYAKTGKMPPERYLKLLNPALKYKAYEVKGIEEKGDGATVTVDVQYQFIAPARGELQLSTALSEQWVRLDGQWYRQVEPQEIGKTSE